MYKNNVVLKYRSDSNTKRNWIKKLNKNSIINPF